jgi:hypothetical protein
MIIAAITLLVQSLIVLCAGLLAHASFGAVLISSVISIVLVVSSFLTFRGSLAAGYLGGALTFLSAIYFAYRLIATEQFMPSGIFLILSFVALFSVLLGVFLGLRDRV